MWLNMLFIINKNDFLIPYEIYCGKCVWAKINPSGCYTYCRNSNIDGSVIINDIFFVFAPTMYPTPVIMCVFIYALNFRGDIQCNFSFHIAASAGSSVCGIQNFL